MGNCTYLLGEYLSLENGGMTLFDYFFDKGHKKVNVYGKSEALEAYYVICDSSYIPCTVYSKYPNRVGKLFNMRSGGGVYPDVDISSINKMQDEAIMLCGEVSDAEKEELSQKFKALFTEYDVILYGLIKKAIVNPIRRHEVEKNIKLNVVRLSSVAVTRIERRSEYEQLLLTNKLNNEQEQFVNYINRNVVFKEYSDDEYAQTRKNGCSFLRNINGIAAVDKKSQYTNVNIGNRFIPNVPSEYSNCVYCVGNSQSYGTYLVDSDTVPSNLQRLFNQNGYTIKVYNIPSGSSHTLKYMSQILEKTDFKDNDTIVLSVPFNQLNSIYHFFDVMKPFQRPHDLGELFADKSHVGPAGSRRIADIVFEYISRFYRTGIQSIAHTEVKKRDTQLPVAAYQEIHEWLSGLTVVQKQIGAIVMNCNPFTFGHRYLVEYAASQCLHLYVFVVEEDKSIFPFKDRFELVKQGTKDLQNVTVLPSGKFIISQTTFSDYFTKAEIQDKQVDPSTDVELFANEIAPALGINIRFAGEEPLDNITQQYNDAMAHILPKHGVKFKTIPRKEENGEVISASRVRKLLKDKVFIEIAKLVPTTTLDYLKEFEYHHPTN